jgi:hypothetical protein
MRSQSGRGASTRVASKSTAFGGGGEDGSAFCAPVAARFADDPHRHVDVAPGHLQGRMTEDLLEAKGVAAVVQQVVRRERVPP